MKKLGEETPGPAGKARKAPDVSEGFRSARSALGQISTDLERLRRQAASLVKGAHRPAK